MIVVKILVMVNDGELVLVVMAEVTRRVNLYTGDVVIVWENEGMTDIEVTDGCGVGAMTD